MGGGSYGHARLVHIKMYVESYQVMMVHFKVETIIFSNQIIGLLITELVVSKPKVREKMRT